MQVARIEARYFAELVRLVVDPIIRTTRAVLLSELPRLVTQTPDAINAQRTDSVEARADGYLDVLRMLVERMHVELERTGPPHEVDDVLHETAITTSRENAAWIGRQAARAGIGVGDRRPTREQGDAARSARHAFAQTLRLSPSLGEPHLQEQLDGWAKTNADLIGTMKRKYLSDVQQVVARGVSSGRRHEDIAAEIQARFLTKTATDGDGARRVRGVTYQARRMARDQVSKLNADLTRTRHQQLGVDRYTWRTLRDPRVRPEHADREGKVFAYSNPPEDGNPGEAVQCRCYADPVLDDIL